jgi:hypothetical protein
VKVTAVTCVKNEGPFVLEWIAFGQVIGCTDFLFYSNDCDDGTDTLLDQLDSAGVITHLPNPAKGRKYQMEALRHARRHPLVTGADWLWNADVDEFLNIKTGTGKIAELVEACGTPDAISVTHQYFANGGVQQYQDLPVISQFHRSHNPDIWCDRFEIEVKTLLRPDFPASYFGVHRPYLPDDTKRRDAPRWTDGSGRPVPVEFLLNKGEGRRFGYDASGARNFATVNHYALRSLDSYLVKSDRGDANRDYRFFDDSYWRDRNDTAYHDTSIDRFTPALLDAIKDLKSLPGVDAAHDFCVRRHIEKCAQLSQDPAFGALRDKLIHSPHLPQVETDVLDRLGIDWNAA